MKRYAIAAAALAFTFAAAVPTFAEPVPRGKAYMVNVHAYDNCPSGDFLDSSRRMIAVKANYSYDPSGVLYDVNMPKTNQISLMPGADFQVLDGNACNKGGAVFQLPTNVSTAYEVFVRLVGKPGTGINVNTCANEAIDLDGDQIVEDVVMCSTEKVIETRGTGAPKAVNVTRELLTLCLDTYADGNMDGACDERFNLFDSELEDYFWQWNTVGKAKAQLIFVPIATVGRR